MISTLHLITSIGFWSLTYASKGNDTSVSLPQFFGNTDTLCYSIYDELGCTPLGENDENGCRKQYSCGNLSKLKPHTCIFNGKASVNRSTTDEIRNRRTRCSGWCRCMTDVDYKNIARSYDLRDDWSCALVECSVQPKQGCIDLYENYNDCCPSRTYCEGKDPKPSTTCKYRGKTYVEGEIIINEEACKRCICDHNFNASLRGSFCRNQDCTALPFHLSRTQENCKLEYSKGVTYCPRPPLWHISRILRRGMNKANSSSISRARCRLGGLALYIGEKLVGHSREYIECSCIAPPDVTCIRLKK